eukprot:CAMPEP_0172159478 /NCGR_PEP_ID=MMETSP1050-20130122/4991_1 /TAXON_ID=233186 /ORGANISM="Cryptomonas curvata, Strain CCAP979/52" /LENGTH=194 /DNA_ID=CAMNT_0012829067 /DNA_START=84 /DNA_END=671 /DNA_ORIENTATION=+
MIEEIFGKDRGKFWQGLRKFLARIEEIFGDGREPNNDAPTQMDDGGAAGPRALKRGVQPCGSAQPGPASRPVQHQRRRVAADGTLALPVDSGAAGCSRAAGPEVQPGGLTSPTRARQLGPEEHDLLPRRALADGVARALVAQERQDLATVEVTTGFGLLGQLRDAARERALPNPRAIEPAASTMHLSQSGIAGA